MITTMRRERRSSSARTCRPISGRHKGGGVGGGNLARGHGDEEMSLSHSPLALLTPEQKAKLLRSRGSLSEEARAAFKYTWEYWARPEQLPPSGDWRVWMILAGRGFGKTRVLSEWVRSQIESGRS